jgi:putative toxin-antitoxin system antitoxin component (TIGR02293 family)
MPAAKSASRTSTRTPSARSVSPRLKAAAGGWGAFRDAIVRESPSGRIDRIRAGTRANSLLGAAAAIGVSRETIFRLVGLPVSTATRKITHQAILDAAATERLARLALAQRQAEDTFGDSEAAREWLRSTNVALGGGTPLSMLDTDIGAREVAKILAAIAHGGVV